MRLVSRAVLVLLGFVSSPLRADEDGSISAQTGSAQRKADFLFGSPRGFVGVRGGVEIAAAGSDIYDFFTGLLTLDKRDFEGALLGVDVGLAVHPRIDVMFGFELSQGGGSSEYRDYVDTDDLPIIQDTRLRIVPITGNVRFYLTPRGRQISRFAFVPATVRVYAGGGGGLVWYELVQTGDFVDIGDLSIFTSTLRSSGVSFGTQAFGGVEVALGTKWFLSFEGKYLWSKSDLGQDFVSFAPIDLSGARISAGINFVF
jgi:hypothetical protein